MLELLLCRLPLTTKVGVKPENSLTTMPFLAKFVAKLQETVFLLEPTILVAKYRASSREPELEEELTRV